MKFLRIASLFFLLSSVQAFAEYQWGFANTSFNRLDWAKSTEDKSSKTDFNYLELEGGSQYSWGELYGFFDVENPTKPADEVRTAAKGSIRYYLKDTKVSLYAHVYDFNALGFAEQNRVVGFGYQVEGKSWWLKPFLGFHDVSQTFFSGSNGYMGGWVFWSNFKINGVDLNFTNWHEIEFARRPLYAAGNGNKKIGQNGAAAIWLNTQCQTSFGLQWRYAMNKLGTVGSQSAIIYTLKYNF